jgi:hypothetical protein
VAVYEQGSPACYLLQEFAPEEVRWTEDSWTFGDTVITESSRDGRTVLNASLDCPIPGSNDRLQGHVVMEGPSRRESGEDVLHGAHDWAPLLGPSEGRWTIDGGCAAYDGAGRGYHDCNGGRSTLEDAGIYEWTWGRLPFPDEEVIYYIAWPERDAPPEALGVRIDATGQMSRVPLTVRIPSWGRARARMRFPEVLQLSVDGSPWLEVRTDGILDDGPFYLRYFIVGSRGGRRAVGFGEICRPDRIDRDLHRPLVRMRVHQVGGTNSIWLPLFSGPRRGRVRRLVSNLTRGR